MLTGSLSHVEPELVAAPDFESTNTVYLSWAEAGAGGSGAAVGRATLSDDPGSVSLEN